MITSQNPQGPTPEEVRAAIISGQVCGTCADEGELHCDCLQVLEASLKVEAWTMGSTYREGDVF
jgi:hypothetical protein